MFQTKVANLNVICILRHMHKPLLVRQYTFEKIYKSILRGFRVKDVEVIAFSAHPRRRLSSLTLDMTYEHSDL
jgi:hypothetical protein